MLWERVGSGCSYTHVLDGEEKQNTIWKRIDVAVFRERKNKSHGNWAHSLDFEGRKGCDSTLFQGLAEPPLLCAGAWAGGTVWREEGELESEQPQPGAEIREEECYYGEAAARGGDDSCWRTYSCWSGIWHRLPGAADPSPLAEPGERSPRGVPDLAEASANLR